MFKQFFARIHKACIAATTAAVLAALAVAEPAVAHTAGREKAFQALVEQITAHQIEMHELAKQAKTRAERSKVLLAGKKGRQEFLSSMVATYHQNPRDQVAFDAMLFVLQFEGKEHLRAEICRNLRQYHLRNTKLNLVISKVSLHIPLSLFNNECEQLVKAAVRGGATEEVRNTAQVLLANVYYQIADFLANISALKMTPEEYATSPIRGQYDNPPQRFLERVSKQIRERQWLNRQWMSVRRQALQLATAVQQSPYEIKHYNYSHAGYQEYSGEPVKDLATGVRFKVEHAMAGGTVVDFGARDLNGNPVSFSNHRGKILMLDIWATWCEPCVANLPEMRSLQRRMQGRPFELITLSLDKKPQDVKVFMRRNSMPFTNWYIGENQEFFATWPVWPIPKVFVIDENGVIRSTPRISQRDLNVYLERLVQGLERQGSR